MLIDLKKNLYHCGIRPTPLPGISEATFPALGALTDADGTVREEGWVDGRSSPSGATLRFFDLT